MDTSTARRLHTINHNLRCHHGEINKLHAKETFNNIYINGDKGTRLSNGVLTGLGLPVNNSDAVNKEYVHNVIQGLDLKESVVAASIENISNLNDIPSPLYIDGHEIKHGDRVLLKNQTNKSENGTYTYKQNQLVKQVNDKSNIEQKNENIESRNENIELMNENIELRNESVNILEHTDDWKLQSVTNAFIFVENGIINKSTGFVAVSDGEEKIGGEHNVIFTIFSENTSIKGSKNINVSKGDVISLKDNIDLSGTIKANTVETSNIKSSSFINITSEKASLGLKGDEVKINGTLVSYSNNDIGKSNHYFDNMYVHNIHTKGQIKGHLHGNAATTTALATARTIGGVSFDGTADISLPGVNSSGNQDTSGNAATTTALATARTIGGVSFDGSANIDIGLNNLSDCLVANNSLFIGNDISSTKGDKNIAIGKESLGYNASNGTSETTSSHTSGVVRTGFTNSWQTITPNAGYENHSISEIDLYFKYSTGAANLKLEIYDSSSGNSSNPNNLFGNSILLGTAINSSITAGSSATVGTFVFDPPVNISGTVYIWLKDNSGSSDISIVFNDQSEYTDGGAGNNYGRLNHVVRGNSPNSASGNHNVALGYQSLNSITSGSNNIGINNLSGTTITTGTNNICIGYQADVSSVAASNQVVIGQGAKGHGDNIAVIGNSSCTAWHPPEDDQIDLGSSSYRFKDIHATNGTIQTSDMRQQKSIENINIGLDFINELRPVSYKWKTGKNNNNKKYGLIAQEVETVLQQNGIYNKDEIIKYDSESDNYGISYTELIAPLIKSVQELSNKNDQLHEEINFLKQQ